MLQDNDPGNTRSSALKDEHTDQRIHEHLSNRDDIITEDDIRNVVTSIDPQNPLQDPLPPDQAGADEIPL